MNSDVHNQSVRDNGNPYWYWITLIFSCFYFSPVFYNLSQYSKYEIGVVITVYIIFVFLYNLCSKAKERNIIPPVVAILVLCIFATPLNPGTFTLIAYTAFFVAFALPKKESRLGLFFIILIIILSAYFFVDSKLHFIIPGMVISLGLYAFGYLERYERINRLLQTKSQEQIEQLAKIAERERIARDLHDLLGHSLSSIALKSELAQKLIESKQSDAAKLEISAVADLSRSILSEVRQAVTGFKKRQLKGVIEQLKSELQSANFVVITTNIPTTLPPKIESALTLIIKESVTNILRHSQGDTVELNFTQDTDHLKLSISDNGHIEKIKWGNGLFGMQERCKLLHGRFTADILDNTLRLNINLPLSTNT